ncbi:MAG: thiamine phosphate synthase [Acidobacteria bacterium]|nr:thiamine phosphate synthase [Acidobacteriota bacterium]
MHLLAISPGEGFDPIRWAPVLESGIDGFLIREPGLGPEALRQAATWCRQQAPGVKVWVRGLAVAGCGLHLPEGEGGVPRGLALSRPLHDEGGWADRSQAQQVLVSPIFPTPGKGPAWGIPRLHRFLGALPAEGPRLLALGGVTPGLARGLRHPRLDGIAAIRAFWAGDPQATVAAFRAAWV